ncbi:phage tail fiber protein [Azonexus hydrophilus]|uniref:phage tail fiber domain-containing protein n=1 Tax=Azonexus hydrophilus TaxID=418702 RepID=UPI000429B246|nr:phage tail fiber protein [Azonexus hydrophilus]
MPVLQQTPVITYVANGSVKTFAYPFQILDSSDLQVYVNGLFVAYGYSVTGVGNVEGGSVVFVTAPSNGSSVRLVRETSMTRITDYVEGGSITADVLDRDFDRVVMMLQEQAALTFHENNGGNLDATNRNIVNVASPINPHDAVNKEYTDGVLPALELSSSNSAAAANNSAIAAAASADSASDSAIAASSSAMAAAASAASIALPIPIASGGTGAVTTAAARLNLGLTTAATTPLGTAANNIIQLDENAMLPAVDGRHLTNVGIVHQSVFDAAGSYVWQVPSGLPSSAVVVVEMWGAGGGGGNRLTTGNAAGGGGGAYVRFDILASKFPSGEGTFIIGAGGTRGTSGANANGGAGGATQLLVWHIPSTQVITISANGGAGGAQAAVSAEAAGGAGGVVTAGFFSIAGAAGGSVSAGNVPAAAGSGWASTGGMSRSGSGTGLGGWCLSLNNNRDTNLGNACGGAGGLNNSAQSGGDGYAVVTVYA